MANIVVLFEVKLTKSGVQKYLDLAAMLKPMLSGFEGFIRAERFSSLNEEGKLLSMNVWTDEVAVERWRNVMQHRKRGGRSCLKATKSRFARRSVPTPILTGRRLRRIPMPFLRYEL